MRPLLLPLVGLVGCLGPRPDASPAGVFDALWSDFDARYALFSAREVDWEAARARWEPAVHPGMDDDALFDTLHGLLAETGDDHVYLARVEADGEVSRLVTAGRLGDETRDDFDRAAVEARVDDLGVGAEGRLSWGRLGPGVGWLHVASFDGTAAGDRPDAWTDEVERALAELHDVEALVVDVRNNGGGRGANALAVAGALVEAPAEVFRVRTRAGPDHDDFDAPVSWSVVPRGLAPPPVVLLTNRFTMSAAETFTAALRTRAGTVHVGETTTGALSAMSHERVLPNGWAYTVSVQDFRLPDGASPEGVGFPPDVAVDNTAEDIAAGRDPMLDRALALAEGR